MKTCILVLGIVLHSVALAAKGASFIETEICGVKLENVESGEAFFKKHGTGVSVDDGAGHRLFANKDGSQILDLIAHSGGMKNSVAEILVIDGRLFPLGGDLIPVKGFSTRRGLRIGMTPLEVAKLYGKPATKNKPLPGVLEYIYRCSDAQECPVIKEVNVPAFVVKCKFIGQHLYLFSIGFEEA